MLSLDPAAAPGTGACGESPFPVPPARGPSAARAFTLLEVVIVMTVVVALLALAAPAMRRALAKNELSGAAGQLRTVLAKARLAAIESGAAQTFSYQPGTNKFVVLSHAAPAAVQGTESSSEEKNLDEAVPQELADAIVFLDPEDEESLPVAAEDKKDASGDSERIRVNDAKPVDQSPQWSRPVVFFPSGRTSSARFRLLGRLDYFVDIELRGLTGTVKLGDIQRPKPKDSLQRDEEATERQDKFSDRPDVSPREPQPSPAPAEVAPQPPVPPEQPMEQPAQEARP